MKVKRQKSDSKTEALQGPANIQLEEIQRALAQLTSNMVGDSTNQQAQNTKHQQEVAVLNQKIDSLTQINSQMT